MIPLLGGALGVGLLLIVIPSDPSLAHVGHFVGLLTGVLYFKLRRKPAR